MNAEPADRLRKHFVHLTRSSMMSAAVSMLRRNIGEPTLYMDDDEVAALGLAAGFPEALVRLPSMSYHENLERMIKYGLIKFDGLGPYLTEKGVALRVQFGLLCSGLRLVKNVGILRNNVLDDAP